MAFPKGKSRKITVDGNEYEYAVNGRYTEDEGYHSIDIYIDRLNTSSKASFEILFKRRDGWHSNARLPVTPNFIENIIKSNHL